MANPTDQSPTKDQAEDQEGDLSLEQLESMILAEAPDFAEDLKSVKSLPSDGSIDLDVVDNGQLIPSDENPWHHPIGLRKFLVMIMPFLPKLWDFQHHFSRICICIVPARRPSFANWGHELCRD